jgi:hypothetical protein
MYNVQNLTNKSIVFQGRVINAYSSETFFSITDYMSLSRLTNAGKVKYVQIQNPIIKKENKTETITEKQVKENNVEITNIEKTVTEIPTTYESAEITIEDTNVDDIKVTDNTIDIVEESNIKVIVDDDTNTESNDNSDDDSDSENQSTKKSRKRRK